MKDNVLMELSKQFALRIIKLYSYLKNEKNEYVMSKQILRCGTSIGANIAESVFAQSPSDYISKLSISLKEASETQYWLILLNESGYIEDSNSESINNDNKIIIGSLVKGINMLKEKEKLK